MASNLAEKTAVLPALSPSPQRRTTSRRRPRRPRPSTSRAAPRKAPVAEILPRSAPAWEWSLAVLSLFVLGRTPVLFYRERIAELAGVGYALPIWLDDGVLRATFAATLGALYIVAARRCDPRTLLRQPFLLAFLAFALASVMWSIEPGVSMWRVTLFAGTAVFGWYLGERYSLRELVGIVGAAAAIGAVASLVAILAWPERARTTNRVEGLWSGAYVNRNLLGLAMAVGLLALPFLWAEVPRRRRPLLLAVGGLELFLLVMSESRTPLVALAASAAVAIPLLVVRKATTRALPPVGGAIGVALVSGYAVLLAQWNWRTIVEWLDRSVNLSKRMVMWFVDAYYIAMQPVKGWGFEAIWAHPPTIAVAQTAYGKFPYSSHSGYFEILLGTGWIGLTLFLPFLFVAAWRAFRFAWNGRDAVSLWPLAFIAFVAVENLSESLFVSGEATWALTVAAAVAATGAGRHKRAVSLPVDDTRGHEARLHDHR